MNPLISPEKAYDLFYKNQAIAIDTRDSLNFSTGHINGAVNIEKLFTYLATRDNGGMAAMAEYFSQLLGKLGIKPTDHLIIYEDAVDQGFGQSCRGFFILDYLGHKNISILHGGLRNWLAKGFPTVNKSIQRYECTYIPTINTSHTVNAEEVLEALNTGKATVLDCRDEDEWKGETSSPYGKDFAPRKGRLTPVKRINWLELVDSTQNPHMFAPVETVDKCCSREGITKDKQVYIYCFKGARASYVYVAMRRAGYDNVKIYFESWNEWSRIPELPIDNSVIN